MKNSPRIAIIGAGFSGIVLSCHLAKQPYEITLIEKEPQFAKGIAYGTKNPAHYLNVRACNMSAFSDNPDHFLTWLQNHKELWQSLHPSFKNLTIAKDSFLPRMIYGSYLEWLSKTVSAAIIQKEVAAISSDLTLTFSDKTTLACDIVVLACGVPENKSFAIEHSNFTQNIWKPHQQSVLQQKGARGHTVIIGSGLTMLDALATLDANQFSGAITVISSNGRIPEAHMALKPNPPKFLRGAPSSALDILKMIRLGIKAAEDTGYDWRSVIDELRPETQKIWQNLPVKERKKLLPLLSIWNRHRHRMPEQYVKLLERIKQSTAFEHVAGSIEKITPFENGLELSFNGRLIYADHILNCSGPELRLNKNPSPLLQSLLSNGMIRPDEINRGIFVDEHSSAIGKAQGSLFVLGQLLFGTKLEITAVPELREGCRKMAEYFYNKLKEFRR